MRKLRRSIKGKTLHNNARDANQLERMRQLTRNKQCFFCDKNYLSLDASPEIHSSRFWYIKKNDYPYQGSTHHYLIVPKLHITKLTEIKSPVWSELLKAVEWLEKNLGTKGYSVFARSGDMRYTGATLDHLHFHFLTGGIKKKNGKIEDNILVTLGHKNK